MGGFTEHFVQLGTQKQRGASRKAEAYEDNAMKLPCLHINTYSVSSANYCSKVGEEKGAICVQQRSEL